MKKITAIILSAALILSLAACGGGSTPTPTPETVEITDGPLPFDEVTYSVGILQQVEHPALDAATDGFMQALIDILGDAVTFDYQNAQNDPGNCSTIANKFVTDGVDLIMANATTALQSASAATGTIPVVGTSITDYIAAGVLIGDADAPGGNVTGASDLAPIDLQIELLRELCPDAETVGIVYCSGEANSIFQADKAEGYLTDAGIAVKRFTVADSNEVQTVLGSVVEQVDVIYIPTDNTMANNMELVKNITVPAGIPVICGEENMCATGGLATLSISYYDMGYVAGEMAAKILTGESEPATTPIAYVSDVTKKYSAEVAEALGISIPEGLEAIS